VRFVVYGAGAVGGVLGAQLHLAGHDVVLIARGPHLAAIQAHGLRVEGANRTQTLAIPAASGPEALRWRPDDVLLLAVKSNDTVAAVQRVSAVADPGTPVVCVQNGVVNEPTVLRWFERVYGVCVMMPTGHLEPGAVQVHCSPTPGILDLGRYPSGSDEPSTRLAQAFTDAGFVSQSRDDIMRWKYRKLLMNLGNAVQAACRPGAAADQLREVVRQEGEVTLAAAGVDVVSAEHDRARRAGILRPHDGTERVGGSSWQSLQRGTGSIESDYLNGEIVVLGRLHGVATPANELVRRVAGRLARERATPGSVEAEDLLAELR